MARDILLRIRNLMLQPVERFDLRNRELPELWKEALGYPYLPPNNSADHGLLPGTSSQLANHFLFHVAQHELLKRLFGHNVLVEGFGLCYPPETKDDFPIFVQHRHIRFYQHKLKLAYIESYVWMFAHNFALSMLLTAEREEWARNVRPDRNWDADFYSYFQALAKNKLTFMDKESLRAQNTKLAILENLFEPAVLRDRAYLVEEFTYSDND